MSLSITPKLIQTIRDSNGKQLFKFPGNTLLDAIYSDLWGVILKYMDYYPFAVGKYGEIYPGYRAMTIDEFHANEAQFIRYFDKNKGLHKMSDFEDWNGFNLIIEDLYLFYKCEKKREWFFVLQNKKGTNDKVHCLSKRKRKKGDFVIKDTHYHQNKDNALILMVPIFVY
jgi:hypothetical protein